MGNQKASIRFNGNDPMFDGGHSLAKKHRLIENNC